MNLKHNIVALVVTHQGQQIFLKEDAHLGTFEL
jgi:hypothetical protein